MKRVYICFILLFSISLISGIEIIAGEDFSFDLGKEYDYYEIVGNSTIINLNISQENNVVTICFDKYMKNDTFSIIFYDKENVAISSSSSSSGGCSSKTKYIVEYKEVPNYILEYVNQTIEKIVPGEVETKITQSKFTLWGLIFLWLVFLVSILIGLVRLYLKGNSIEMKGGLEQDE